VQIDDYRLVRLNYLSAIAQRFSLTIKQHQPTYQPQKPSAKQGMIARHIRSDLGQILISKNAWG
jgi:hypothetical protein